MSTYSDMVKKNLPKNIEEKQVSRHLKQGDIIILDSITHVCINPSRAIGFFNTRAVVEYPCGEYVFLPGDSNT